MIKWLLYGSFVLGSALQALAWTDSELLVWINGDKGYRGLAEVGKKFEKDLGVPVKVEAPESATDKFQAAARPARVRISCFGRTIVSANGLTLVS